MNSNVSHYMSRAYDCLKEAQLLSQNELYHGDCSRAYYAYFDAVRALLATLNIQVRSHAGAQNLFSQHFVKEGKFTVQDIKALARIFDMRQSSDYDAELEAKDATYAVEVTAEFLLQVEAYLRQNNFA